MGCTAYPKQYKPSEVFTQGPRRIFQPPVSIDFIDLARVLHSLPGTTRQSLPIQGTKNMRSLTLAAMTAAALTAGVAHANVTENVDLTYSYNSTFVGTIVCTDDFSSIISVNGILNGYDPNINGFQGLGSSDPITADTALSPILNYSPDASTLFFAQLPDSTQLNWVDFGYSYDSSGITLSSVYNDVDNGETLVSGSVTPVDVPEPGTVTLFALGLFGLVVTRRRRTMSASTG
jgi:hypothetical protein